MYSKLNSIPARVILNFQKRLRKNDEKRKAIFFFDLNNIRHFFARFIILTYSPVEIITKIEALRAQRFLGYAF